MVWLAIRRELSLYNQSEMLELIASLLLMTLRSQTSQNVDDGLRKEYKRIH